MFLLETRRPVTLSIGALVVLTLAFSCNEQTSRVAGAIQVSVVDQTASAVADAKVKLRNRETRWSWKRIARLCPVGRQPGSAR